MQQIFELKRERWKLCKHTHQVDHCKLFQFFFPLEKSFKWLVHAWIWMFPFVHDRIHPYICITVQFPCNCIADSLFTFFKDIFLIHWCLFKMCLVRKHCRHYFIMYLFCLAVLWTIYSKTSALLDTVYVRLCSVSSPHNRFYTRPFFSDSDSREGISDFNCGFNIVKSEATAFTMSVLSCCVLSCCYVAIMCVL